MKNVINSEFIKVKHTSYWKLHIFLPVIGALLYIAYFAIYSTVPVLNKENFLLELTATVFPLVISIVMILTVDVNGSFHKAILADKISEKDTLIQIEKPNEDNNFTINKENCTQLINGNAIYQITNEVVTSDQTEKYLDIIAEKVLFDMNTKLPISKSEQNQIDWTGEKSQNIQRVNWFYQSVYTIKGQQPDTAVAIKINNEYRVAKAISCE